MTFLTTLRVTGILPIFRLVLEGKTGTEISESSRLQFLEIFQQRISPYEMQKTPRKHQ